jgi:hypothetical protein
MEICWESDSLVPSAGNTPAGGHYHKQPHHLSYYHQGFIKKRHGNEKKKRKNGQRKIPK